jgi:glycosyltransferase involved in cell wall biosynthesis
MKLLIISNYAPDAQESMQRYADLIANQVRSNKITVRTVRPRALVRRLVGPNSRWAKWIGYVDKFIIFPIGLLKHAGWADVVHIIDHSNSLYMSVLKHKPTLITCHDMLAVRSAMDEIGENPTGRLGRLLQQMIVSGLNRAQHVVCVSEKTSDDLLRLSELSSSQVSVVPSGLNYDYVPLEAGEAERILKTHGIDIRSPFFLHVGGNQWYKNRTGVLEIFRHLSTLKETSGHQLVMAGKPLLEAQRAWLVEHRLIDRVTEIVGVPNEGLNALYSLATALIFPSLEEGFGWPVLEAQASGCVVATTNRSPMTEVGGDAALYFDPSFPEQAAEVISRGISLSHELRERGLENAMKFTREGMITRYIELYHRLAPNAQVK